MIPANQEFLFTRQHHMADRMGEHWDYRLVHGDKAYSFATKKEMPEAGKSIMLFEQPVHDRAYALSKKVVIPKGQYGAGTTYLDWIRKAKIGENSTDNQMTIYTKDGEKFLLKRMKSDSMYGDKSWLFKNLGKVEKMKNKYLEKIAANRFVKEFLKHDDPLSMLNHHRFKLHNTVRVKKDLEASRWDIAKIKGIVKKEIPEKHSNSIQFRNPRSAAVGLVSSHRPTTEFRKFTHKHRYRLEELARKGVDKDILAKHDIKNLK